jgi:hypothetical protein
LPFDNSNTTLNYSNKKFEIPSQNVNQYVLANMISYNMKVEDGVLFIEISNDKPLAIKNKFNL